ncbi:uncharacterized protein LOC62_01G001325 [Vanrija pseudolonga]|uniref:Pentacotripeptide-repeat region of PRORP domain-containing protein n=1 Tax=Vanrija pseudolonga TaxID=143232 RepID=A0AAF1BN88_9TREE|nr:hypothetical protein LOC62_01G001325 [Vanrija pseudolonga]
MPSPKVKAARRAAARRVLALPLPPPLPATLPPSTPLAGPGPSSARWYGSATAPRQSAFSDFFSRRRRRAPQQEESPAAAVLASLASGRTGAINTAYFALLDARRQLSAEDAASVMEALATRADPRAFSLLERVYAALESVHGVTPSERHYAAMITGLATAGRARDALAFARETGSPVPFDAVAAAAALHEPDAFDEVITAAKAAGQLSERLYAPRFEALLDRRAAKSMSDVDAIAAAMDSDGLTLGPWCEVSLARVYLVLGENERAAALVGSWAPETAEPELAPALYDAALAVYMGVGDTAAVERVVAAMSRTFGTPGGAYPRALEYLVRSRLGGDLSSANSIIEAADAVGRASARDLPPSAWQRVILGALEGPGGLQTAFEVYTAARTRATVIDATLAQALVEALAWPPAAEGSARATPRLAEAMEVYGDLITAADGDRSVEALQPTARLYLPLLRACAALGTEAHATALQLLADIKDRGAHFPPVKNRSHQITELIVDLMRSAGGHPEAHAAYRAVRAAWPYPLSRAQHDTIVTQFLKLEYPDSVVSKPEFVFSLMDDMRAEGYHPGTLVLTTLLSKYAALCKRMQRQYRDAPAELSFRLQALLSATRDVHSLVSLDALIEVDVPLLTALMDALSSAGVYEEAMEVWDQIVRRREGTPPEDAARLFGPAISVALDTCGFYGNLPRARKIWHWAQRHDLRTDRHYLAWVECLLRCGKLDEALDVITGMLRPSKEIAALPLKLYRSTEDINLIRERLSERFPEWWDELAASVNL